MILIIMIYNIIYNKIIIYIYIYIYLYKLYLLDYIIYITSTCTRLCVIESQVQTRR